MTKQIPKRAHEIARNLEVLERAAFWHWIEQRARTPKNQVFSIYLPSLATTYALTRRQLGRVVAAIDNLDTKRETRPLKTVAAPDLITAYNTLYPGEHTPVEGVDLEKHRSDIQDTFQRWLERYGEFPETALATTNWHGKVTKALFEALGIKQPRTKTGMLRALMNFNEIVGQYCFPTDIVYADRTRDDPATKDYKRLAYLNYASLKLDLEPDLKGDLLAYVVAEAAAIQARKGQRFQIAGNLSITLGDADSY
jgi:hypothetical protein